MCTYYMPSTRGVNVWYVAPSLFIVPNPFIQCRLIGMFHSTSKISGACLPNTSRMYEDPYLRHELGGQEEYGGIQFDQFVQAVFPETLYMALERQCTNISTSHEILENLRTYLEAVHRSGIHEWDLYDPFATLVSSIIHAAGAQDFRYIQMNSAPHGAAGHARRS